MQKLSSSLEDYLEQIYIQVLKNGFAKVTALSNALNVRKASVTSALINLADKKLINYEPYSSITLTDEGLKLSKRIYKKHIVLNKFFNEVLKLDNSAEIACAVEHLISDKNLAKIEKFISDNIY